MYRLKPTVAERILDVVPLHLLARPDERAERHRLVNQLVAHFDAIQWHPTLADLEVARDLAATTPTTRRGRR